MAAFTPEQQAILYSIMRILSVKLGDLVNLIERTNIQLVALHNILGEKGVITAEEWNAATAEVRAAFAVDLATNRQLQALDDELHRLLGGEPEGTRSERRVS
jgi:hypothetical protein